MPRLSDYLRAGQQQEGPERPAAPAHAAPVSSAAAVAAATAPVDAGAAPSTTPTAAHVDTASSSSAPSATTVQQLHERYIEQHRRRVRDRGTRCYRHPDGSLRPEPPAADAYTQANRVHWRELVDFCRTHGGDREYDTHGFSLRYGTGVPAEAHQLLLEQLDLGEELLQPPAVGDRDGDPLADPAHPFNLEWKQLAQEVFAAAPYQWKAGAV